jgi:hypothetical protein
MLLRIILLLLALSFMQSCGSLSMSDKAVLNHPAMDLTKNQTQDYSGALCKLGDNASSVGQGCTTCAH